MEFLDMPPTLLAGYAVDRRDIEETLNATGCAWPVRHFMPVYGAPRSIRIFSPDPIPESVPLPRPMDALGMTHELLSLRIVDGARYELQHNPRLRKGWEIRVGRIGEIPIVVALATWVP